LKPKKFDSFGAALKHVVNQRDLKQKKIASETGIHYSQVSNYVNAVQVPDDKNKEILMDYLGIQIKQQPDGQWLLESAGPTDRVEELFNEYEVRKSVQPASRSERALLIEFLKVHAEATLKGLHLLAEMENAHPD
jgi:transcriptional regulator with XRE-family HTH domain